MHFIKENFKKNQGLDDHWAPFLYSPRVIWHASKWTSNERGLFSVW